MSSQDLQASSSRVQGALMEGEFPTDLEGEVMLRLSDPPFQGAMVAVRSSGTDEDSAAHSFAGVYLIQKSVSSKEDFVLRKKILTYV